MPFWVGQETLQIEHWVLRTVVVFLWLMLVTKLMGRREIGRMNLFDFAISIIMGSVLAGVLVDSKMHMIGAIVSVGALGLLDIVISWLALKHSKLRRLLQEEPLMLIKNGQIQDIMLRKARYNLDDLLMELRLNSISSPADVEFAILEPNGRVSVIPKSQARPLTPADLGVPTSYEGYSTVLIEDGNIIGDNLQRIGLSQQWLTDQLKKENVTDPKQVMAAILDTQGRLYVSVKQTATSR